MANFRIAVLGAGNIGGTLGKKWAAAGHQVAFGVSNPDGPKSQAVRAELGDKAVIGSVADALANADVVVLAVPGNAVDEIVSANAAQLDGKIIIDTANRMGGGVMNSFATLQKLTPKARIYRAFNTLGWENFANPEFAEGKADLFYCGPEGETDAIVEQMITEIGLRPMRVGGVEQVGLVDSIAGLWFALALGRKMGRHLAFKVLTR